MKQALCLVTICGLLFSPLFAGTVAGTKFYCDVEQIELTDSMILIHLEEGTFEIDSLLVDQGGIYFTEDTLRCTHCRRPVNPKNICECPMARAYK